MEDAGRRTEILTLNASKFKERSVPGEDKVNLLSPNSVRAFKRRLDPENRNLLALKHIDFDDYRTNAEVVYDVYRRVGWKPYIDMCANIIGSNSLCPLYYDADSDATQQA